MTWYEGVWLWLIWMACAAFIVGGLSFGIGKPKLSHTANLVALWMVMAGTVVGLIELLLRG